MDSSDPVQEEREPVKAAEEDVDPSKMNRRQRWMMKSKKKGARQSQKGLNHNQNNQLRNQVMGGGGKVGPARGQRGQ